MLAGVLFLVNWKAWGRLTEWFWARGWFPFNVPGAIGSWVSDPAGVPAVLVAASGDPGFWYSLAYTLIVSGFGIARIRRRKTPYVAAQTITAHRLSGAAAVPPAISRAPVAAGERRIRFRRRALDRDAPVPRPLVVARVRFHPRLAAVRLERLHEPTALGMARDFRRPDVRHHPGNRVRLGQRRVLRMDLFVRSARGDPRRPAPLQDAARSGVVPTQHGRPSHSRRVVCATCPQGRRMGRFPAPPWERARSGDSPPRRTGRVCRTCSAWQAGSTLSTRSSDRSSALGSHFHASGPEYGAGSSVLSPRSCTSYAPILALPDLRREGTVHLVQRLHDRMSPGDRRHGVREQGDTGGRSAVACGARRASRSAPTGVLQFGRIAKNGNGKELPLYDRIPASPVRMREG